MAKAKVKQEVEQNMDVMFGARRGEQIPSGGFKMLAHDRITVRPQVRRTFDAGEMDELRGAIRALREQGAGIEGTGVLQALLVSPEGDGYRLVAGEKRFRATRDEEIPFVPCVVVPAASEGLTRLMQLSENAVRSAPPILEEAEAMQQTARELGLSVRDLARALGKTSGYVTNRLSLLKMSTDVQEMAAQRSDTLKHAPLIEKVQDPEQRAHLIRAVVEDGLSVKALEARVATPEPLPPAPPAALEAPLRAPVARPPQAERRDPVADLLEPAVRMADEAARLLAQGHLSHIQIRKARAQTKILESVLADIQEILR